MPISKNPIEPTPDNVPAWARELERLQSAYVGQFPNGHNYFQGVESGQEYASERRAARRNLSIAEIGEFAMHTDTDRLGEEMPDYTLEQLVLKAAMVGAELRFSLRDNWPLVVDSPWGRFFFAHSADGTEFVLDQVL